MDDIEVAKNIRMRLIEALEVASSKSEQNIAEEIFENWGSNYPLRGAAAKYSFKPEELPVLAEFDRVMDIVLARLPQPFPGLTQYQSLPECDILAEAAKKALSLLER
jgi:hypothetical protein